MRLIVNVLCLCFCLYFFNCQAQLARNKLVSWEASKVGIREATNHNDGPFVARILLNVGLKEGYEWCSAFQSYAYDTFHLHGAHSAWAPAWFTNQHIIYIRGQFNGNPLPGDLVGFWYGSRIGHVGMLEYIGSNYYRTIEGNYGAIGGVYRVYRPKWQIYAITNWIDK